MRRSASLGSIRAERGVTLRSHNLGSSTETLIPDWADKDANAERSVPPGRSSERGAAIAPVAPADKAKRAMSRNTSAWRDQPAVGGTPDMRVQEGA